MTDRAVDTQGRAYNVKCVVCLQPQSSNDDYGKHLRDAHGLCGDCSIGESEQCMERCKERGLFEPQPTVATFEEAIDVVVRLRERALEAGYPKASLYEEAADEIERLRKGLEGIIEVCESDEYGCNVESFVEIVERADAALRRGNVHG